MTKKNKDQESGLLSDEEYEATNQIIAKERLLPVLVLETLISHRDQFFTGNPEEIKIKLKWLGRLLVETSQHHERIVILKWRTLPNIQAIQEKQYSEAYAKNLKKTLARLRRHSRSIKTK